MKKLRKGLLGLVILVALFCSVMVFMPASASAVENQVCWRTLGWTYDESQNWYYTYTVPQDGYEDGDAYYWTGDFLFHHDEVYLYTKNTPFGDISNGALFIGGVGPNGYPIATYRYYSPDAYRPSDAPTYIASLGLPPNINDITPPTAPNVSLTSLSAFIPPEPSYNYAYIKLGGSTDFNKVVSYDVYVNSIKRTTLSADTGYITYLLGNLVPNTTYTVGVIAKDAAGFQSQPRYLTFKTKNDTTPPTSPILTFIESDNPTVAGLYWHSSTDNAAIASYDIYNGLEKILTVKSSEGFGTYVFDNLTPSTNYNMFVVAKDTTGNESIQSNTVSFTTASDTVSPTAPTLSLAPNSLTPTTAKLVFPGATDNIKISEYDIHDANKSPGWSFIATSSTDSYTLTGLTPQTTYKVYVKVYDFSGNSAVSNVLTFTTPYDVTPPTAPGLNIYMGGVTYTTANLTWYGATDNIGVVSYDLYSGTTKLATVNGGSGTIYYDLTGLKPGTTYNLTVKARDAAGNISSASNILTITTTADTVPPTAPTSFTIYQGGVTETTAGLNWIGATDNVKIAYFEIYNGTTKLKTVNAGSGTSYNAYLTGLLPNTKYNLTVKAIDVAGLVSPASSVLTIYTDIQAPNAPTGLMFDFSSTPKQEKISWTASTDNMGVVAYDIYSGTKKIGTSTSTSFIINPLDLLNLYYPSNPDVTLYENPTYPITVKARDAAGNVSIASETIIFTAPFIP